MGRKSVIHNLDKLTVFVNTFDMTQTLQGRVAAEVRAELARKRMTQGALADALGRSDAYVTRRLTGETAFDLTEVEKIAEILRVPVQQLIGECAA
jgi:cyanate lyase